MRKEVQYVEYYVLQYCTLYILVQYYVLGFFLDMRTILLSGYFSHFPSLDVPHMTCLSKSLFPKFRDSGLAL